ncbi:MAG: hypothetical protein ACYTKD_02575 [Planctomycetota bacterium]|jgi:hypothetical protein
MVGAGRHRRAFLLLLVAVLLPLLMAGCKEKPEHPRGEHPTSEQPEGEHPKKEGAKPEHPKGEHPKPKSTE